MRAAIFGVQVQVLLSTLLGPQKIKILLPKCFISWYSHVGLFFDSIELRVFEAVTRLSKLIYGFSMKIFAISSLSLFSLGFRWRE